MKRPVFPLLAALALSASVLSANAGPIDQRSESMGRERMQQWSADHQTLLDAKLAGLKAGLKLTSNEEPLWAPFDGAVRDAAKMRMEHMRAMMDHPSSAEDNVRGSPVDHVATIARDLTEDAAALTKVADAAKPLYASLDDSQKQVFGWLGQDLLMMGQADSRMNMADADGEDTDREDMAMRGSVGTTHADADKDTSDDE